MLGGGVVVLVAVLLWALYLMPSILRRARYDAAERNALRLNRALRVLAETSEAPQEVRVELTTRQARAQQKAARRAQAEVERLRRERDEIEAERARLERERARAELEERRDRIEAERAALERRDAERAVEAERRAHARERDAQMRYDAVRAAEQREERKQTRSYAARGSAPVEVLAPRAPAGASARMEHRDAADESSRFERAERAVNGQAKARRRLRLIATLVAATGLGLVAWGVLLAVSAAPVAAWAGFAVGGAAMFAVGALVLRRMAAVAGRAAAARASEPANGADEADRAAAASRVARQSRPQLINAADRGWTPRRIPAPLASTAGSTTATAADARAAREQLLEAAREEALRDKAEQMNPAPVALDEARSARGDAETGADAAVDVDPAGVEGARVPEADAAPPAAPKQPSRYASIGYVDEAENERHMREFLARRAG